MRRHNASLFGRVRTAAIIAVTAASLLLTACSARLEKSDDDQNAATPNRPATQLAAWAHIHSSPYQIGETALQAYAYAAAAMDRSVQGCGIGWPTLAAIGGVESEHGTATGGKVNADATVTPKLRSLKNSDPARPRIADTDGGRYDGTSSEDRPMGPLQFLPSKWEQWSTDADNDGTASPDDYDDAALSLARFLCATGGDLRSPQGWSTAVAAFDPAPDFSQKVHDRAQLYSR